MTSSHLNILSIKKKKKKVLSFFKQSTNTKQ